MAVPELMLDPGTVLRQRLAGLIAGGHSVTEIADLAGVSRPTVSRFMNEPGFGSDAVKAKLATVAEQLEQQPAAAEVQVTPDGFVQTKDALEILGVCDLAAEHRKLAVIVGFPGGGKTHALDRFAARVPGTIMVRANSNMSSAGLCIRIGQQLGLDLRNGQSLDYMMDSIVNELRQRPRLMIVDEADYLVTRTSLRKIEILRTIYDEAGIGMVICGMPRLMQYLVVGPSAKDNLAQLYSRVAYLRRLVGVSEPEVRAFCRNHPVDDEAMQLLYRFTRQEERGGLRRLDNLLRNASLLADGGMIRLKHVKAAAEELELTRQ